MTPTSRKRDDDLDYHAYEALFGRWLSTRARIVDCEALSDEEMSELLEIRDRLAHQLMTMPAARSVQVFHKVEILADYLTGENGASGIDEDVATLMFGGLRADLLRFVSSTTLKVEVTR